MRFVLLDDEKGHNEILRQMVTDVCRKEGLEADFALVTLEQQQVLDFAAGNSLPCIYFLDIELSEENTGIDLCRQLRLLDAQAMVVYVSAYQHYALECCRSHAFDFLLKPVQANELRACLLAADSEMKKQKEHLLPISFRSQTMMLPLDDVLYFEKKKMLLVAHLRSGEERVWRSTFEEVVPGLAGLPFMRCHRCYLVNARMVRQANYSTCQLTLADGTVLPIARRSLGAVEEMLGKACEA